MVNASRADVDTARLPRSLSVGGQSSTLEMGPKGIRNAILSAFVLMSISSFLLVKYGFALRSHTVSYSSTDERFEITQIPQPGENYTELIQKCELCERELASLQAFSSSPSHNESSSSTACPEKSNAPSSSEATPASTPRTESTSPRNSSSTISSLWKDPELQSVVAAFRAVVPQKFLEGFKNPCWYVDYQIFDGIVKFVEILELQRQNEKMIPQKLAVHSAIRLMYGHVLPGTKKLLCLPYFIMLGFIKCGTTTLHDIIAQHPHFAKPLSKEIFWWTKIHWVKEFPTNVVHIMRYLYHFVPAAKVIATQPTKRITGDSSPTYMHESPFFKDFYTSVSREDIELIPQIFSLLFPKTKYVVIFREPADRMRSDFYYFPPHNCPEIMPVINKDTFHKVMTNRITAFKQCMAEIGDDLRCMYLYRKWLKKDFSCLKFELRMDATLYYLSVELWLRYFPREQFLFLRSEDMAADKVRVAKQVYKFLELDPVSDSFLMGKLGRQQQLNHGPTNIKTDMRTDTKKMLRAFFAPYNKKLSDLLNDDRFLWNDIP